MGIFFCTERRTDSEDEFYRSLSERQRKRVQTCGMLSITNESVPPVYGSPFKSERLVLESKPGELQTIIYNQQKEIDRLTDMYQKSVQEAELKEAELKNLKSQQQSNEESSRSTYDAECILTMGDALQSRVSAQIMINGHFDQEKSSTLTSESSISPPSIIQGEIISKSDSIGGSPVLLEDFEFPIKAKQSLGHQRSGSLPADMIRAALGNKSYSEGVESKFAQQLDAIDSKIMSTNGELKKMRRCSIDILVGTRDGENWQQVEKSINDLTAKKYDLEMERFETCMNLQNQLMVTSKAEANLSKMVSEHNENDDFDPILSTGLSFHESKKNQYIEENMSRDEKKAQNTQSEDLWGIN